MVAYLRLLGIPQLTLGEEGLELPSGKTSALLYYLAYQGRWVSRDVLLYLFWPDSAETPARSSLRKLLTGVRRLPYTAQVEIEPTRLRWPICTDVADFKQALAEGDVSKTIQLYGGELLHGFSVHEVPEFESWLELERQELHKAYRETVLNLAGELQGSGRYLEAADLLSRLRKYEPFDEEVLWHYLKNLQLGGQRSKAVGTFEAFEKMLQSELGAAPESTTRRLIDDIQREGTSTEAVNVAVLPQRPARHKLPSQANAFIGREEERAKLAELLGQPGCRLLTITGPGGIGKTRLAIEAAREQLEIFRDSVYFVSLVALSSSGFLVSSIAGAVGFSFYGPTEPKLQLLEYLRDKEMLLLLDNFEHLSQSAVLLSELIQSSPRLKLLVTSRERLNLQEEWSFPLGGMPVPAADVTLEEALSSQSVRLFLQTAKRVHPGFSLSEETFPHVLKLCRIVEGFPLGIELAAVWVRGMPVEDIAREVEANLDFLSTPSRNVQERQKSIRAAFEHSWKLLTPKEQEILLKLSVFRGGFTKEAATTVTGTTAHDLLALIDKSLLRLSSQGRYDRHALLYQYSKEKLAEHPEERVEAQEKHAGYYFRFLREWGEHLQDLRFSPKRRQALEAIDEELENILTAWSWAVAERRVKELQEAMVSLRGFFGRRRRQEAAEVFAQAVAGLDEEDPTHHRALGYALVGQADFLDGYGSERVESAQAGIALLRSLGDHDGVFWGLNVLRCLMHGAGERQQSRQYLQEALALAKEQQNRAWTARVLSELAGFEQHRGGYAEGVAYAREALALWRELGDQEGVAGTLEVMGFLLLRTGKAQEGRSLIQEALQFAQGSQNHNMLAMAYCTAHLGLAAYALEDYERARALHLEAIEIARANHSGFWGNMPYILGDLGRIEVALGRDQAAEDLFLQSLEMALPQRFPEPMLAALAGLAELAAKKGQLESALELSTLVVHHPATEYVHKERVEALVAELQCQLPEETAAEALARGKAMDLERMVEGILRQSSLEP